MAGSVNKVILVGNLGRDPEIRFTQSGQKIANMSIATSETWRDKQSGERREKKPNGTGLLSLMSVLRTSLRNTLKKAPRFISKVLFRHESGRGMMVLKNIPPKLSCSASRAF